MMWVSLGWSGRKLEMNYWVHSHTTRWYVSGILVLKEIKYMSVMNIKTPKAY